MRSLDEIKVRVDQHFGDEVQGTMIAMAGGYHPVMIYHPDYVKEGYEASPLTEEEVVKEMKEYIEFAFGKAYNCRGLSSSRSIWKFTQWLWLLEDHELMTFAEDDDNYAMYGVPVLRKIAEKYGFTDPHPDWTYIGDEMWG